MMEKICGECGHYLTGMLENPCPINPRYVGYLKQGCPQWIEKETVVNDRDMRVCRKCGNLLPVRHFQRGTFVCMDCKEKRRRKRKNI